MKKIFKLLAIALVAVGFTACSDDQEIPDRGQDPAIHAKVDGTYNGTWTLAVTIGTAKEVVYETPGSLTFSKHATEGEHATALHVSLPTVTLGANEYGLDVNTAANISMKSNGEVYFYNTLGTNPLGDNEQNGAKGNTTFYGTVVDGQADMTFTFNYTKAGGRRPTVVKEVYTFKGSK